MAVTFQIPGQFEYYSDNGLPQYRMDQAVYGIPLQLVQEQLNQKRKTTGQKIYVLKGGTGSGKSSAFMANLFLNSNKNIACGQPRIYLAQDKINDLPQFYKYLIPGVNIGYRVGSQKLLPSNKQHSLVYYTHELLAQYIQQDMDKQQQQFKFTKNVKNFCFNHDYIVFDEVHETTQQMIYSYYVVKQFVNIHQNNPKCPIFIFMSATIDVQQVLRYFNMSQPNWYDVGIVKSEKDKFEKFEHYLSKNDQQLNIFQRLEKVMRQIEKMYNEQEQYTKVQKDILVLTKGGKMLINAMQIIRDMALSFPHEVIQYTRQDILDQTKNVEAFEKQDFSKVKIIVSTTLLEVGATIRRLYVCVDTGIRLLPVYMPMQKITKYASIPISLSSKTQRLGRVGRVGDGHFYALYTEDQQFEEQDPSNMIVNGSIQQVMFKLMEFQQYSTGDLVDFQNFLLFQNISADLLNMLFIQLVQLGVITSQSRLTNFGYQALQFQSMLEFICFLTNCPVHNMSILHGLISNYSQDIVNDYKNIINKHYDNVRNVIPILISGSEFLIKFNNDNYLTDDSIPFNEDLCLQIVSNLK